MSECLRLLTSSYKPNTIGVGFSTNTYLKCLGFQTPTPGMRFHRLVYYICSDSPTSGGCRGHDRMDLELPVQSVPNTTKVVNLNLVYCDMYSVQHFVIKFVSDLWQIGDFLWVLHQ